MIINRIENTKRNVIFGVAMKIYQIFLPFVFRTIIVYTLGIEYLGLNSLFTSILQVLNLAELGVGSAMVFSMYKPIADDDDKKICALMRLYKIYYNAIGAIILIVGLAITPFMPKLINGDVPDEINVYVLYLLNLIATVLSYWLFAYTNSILQAYQRQDIVSKITIVVDTFKYLVQLAVLFVFHNYYYYILAILASQVICNVVTAVISQKMFPQYKAFGTLTKEEVKEINIRIKDLFTSKLGGVIVNSADTIVISAFLGLEVLAIYQNYYFIINAIFSFVAIINGSVLAGIGNSLITKSIKDNYNDFSIFIFIEFWILSFCVCCFSTLFQPFISLWMGEEALLDYAVVILLCIYFVLYEYIMIMSVYKEAAGIWHEDRFRPLASGVANLLLNLLLVRFIGIYGIVLSTIVSILLISAPWITANVFNAIFKDESVVSFVKKMCLYVFVMVTDALIVNFVCHYIPDDGILWFAVKALMTAILSNVILIIIYCRHPLFKKSLALIKKCFLNEVIRND